MRYKAGESSVPGLRERRRSKITGTTVSIYDATEAGIEAAERWVTCCENHHSMCSHATLAEARGHLAACGWCGDCQEAAAARREFASSHTCDEGNLADCFECGEEVAWTEEDVEIGEPLCEEDDAVLLASCGCCAVGARIGGHVYCDDCTPTALRTRCEKCKADTPLSVGLATTRATLSALATGAALSVLAVSPPGPIEVVDIAKLPKPPVGSWAAKLREELLNARKGEN